MLSDSVYGYVQLFLTRALMPLHKPKCVGMYHQPLAYCVTQVGRLPSAIVLHGWCMGPYDTCAGIKTWFAHPGSNAASQIRP